MRVRMAASAAPDGVVLHGTAIVVTAQAGRGRVCALKRIAGLLLMIEGKVLAQNIPSIRDVAETAVAGKGLVRHKRPPAAAPSLPRPVRPAIEQDHRGRREQSDQEQSGASIFQPHRVYRDFEKRALAGT